MRRLQLLLPGPVSLHPEVELAQALPMINHRGPEFRELMKEVVQKLQKMFGAEDVAVITASGTGAVEAMVANFVAPGEKMLIVQTGTFSDRMAKIARTLGVDVELVEPPEGEGMTPEALDEAIKRSKATVVGIVANETSTGVAHKNLHELAKVVHENEALILVDAVSYLGGHDMDMEAMDLDAVASATQKALMSPPGLSFVAWRERAEEKMKKVPKRSVYWDLESYKKFYEEKYETPATPAVSVMYALNKALDVILSYGLPNWIRRHEAFSKAMNALVERAGGEVYPKEGWRSNTIVVPILPKGITPAQAKAIARERYGIDIGGGGWKLKNVSVRIGTMGWYGEDVVYRALSFLGELYGARKELVNEVFEEYKSSL